MTLKKSKVVEQSGVLGRPFHLDVFEHDTAASFMVVMFGGSGVDQVEYERRAGSSPMVFEAPCAGFSDLRFVFVTAPYDIPYARMREGDDDADRWVEHVDREILARWPGIPVYLAGYSGGAALALNGVVGLGRVMGAGFLAADGLRADMDVGGLREPPLFLYNDGDRVTARNLSTARRLGRVVVHAGDGGHAFDDYAARLPLLFTDATRICLDHDGASGPDDPTGDHQ